jgi:hypothetical protein
VSLPPQIYFLPDALYCTILHHTAPYCTILHFTAPYCAFAARHCTILHHTAPYCTLLRLHLTAPYCTILHHTSRYCTLGVCECLYLGNVWGNYRREGFACCITLRTVLFTFTFFTALYCTLLHHTTLFEQNLGR